MSQPTLFPIPPRDPRPPRPDTQETRCKRCRGSAEGYCFRFDLALYYEDGHAKLARDDQPIQCDGREWRYLEADK